MFEASTKSIKRVNYLWEIEVNNYRFLKSKNLIFSSSLLANPRCLEILKINSVPLRDDFITGLYKLVDSLIRETRKLIYLKRKIYILYVSSLVLVQNFNHQYLQILFSDVIRDDSNFERIIFQRQSNGYIIISLHCAYIDKLSEINIDNIIKYLTSLFVNYKIFLDLFLQARLIDEMDWRASQPLNHLVPKELQWSSYSNIGFCGDWFDLNNCGGVESAINSSIRLVKLLN